MHARKTNNVNTWVLVYCPRAILLRPTEFLSRPCQMFNAPKVSPICPSTAKLRAEPSLCPCLGLTASRLVSWGASLLRPGDFTASDRVFYPVRVTCLLRPRLVRPGCIPCPCSGLTAAKISAHASALCNTRRAMSVVPTVQPSAPT